MQDPSSGNTSSSSTNDNSVNTMSENPLLDSKFPDVSGKGRGYQINSYDDGIEGINVLRKLSIWQTMDSLEEVNPIYFDI